MLQETVNISMPNCKVGAIVVLKHSTQTWSSPRISVFNGHSHFGKSSHCKWPFGGEMKLLFSLPQDLQFQIFLLLECREQAQLLITSKAVAKLVQASWSMLKLWEGDQHHLDAMKYLAEHCSQNLRFVRIYLTTVQERSKRPAASTKARFAIDCV